MIMVKSIEWQFIVANPAPTPRRTKVIDVKWIPPSANSYKLNRDGSCKGRLINSNSPATPGGLN